jgi:acyl carrier protein
MSWMIFGLVVFLLSGVAVVKYTDWQRTKKIEIAFAHRRQRSTAEFYEEFFREQGVPEEIVSGVKCILEEQLSADLSRIMDSDDFSKNLNFFWDYDSMADVEIIYALEKRFSIQITDEEGASAHTVKDIVDLVWRKVQTRA